MMLIDVHNHTKEFSPDAKMSHEEIISAALERGISVLGITEHFEYDNPDPMDIVQVFDMSEYENAFRSWRSTCPKQLKLLMGVEFGYQHHTAEAINGFASAIPFDVVLLSNHLFGNRDVYFGGDELYKIPKKERFARYINTMAEMCERVDNFDIATHFDYINRYNPDVEEYLLYEDCPSAFDRFFEALISKDKCLELNTRSALKAEQKGCSKIWPDEAIFRRYLSMGGKLISLGSDSHTTDTLGVYFEEAFSYLKALGVKELCYYEGRTPVLYGI